MNSLVNKTQYEFIHAPLVLLIKFKVNTQYFLQVFQGSSIEKIADNLTMADPPWVDLVSLVGERFLALGAKIKSKKIRGIEKLETDET